MSRIWHMMSKVTQSLYICHRFWPWAFFRQGIIYVVRLYLETKCSTHDYQQGALVFACMYWLGCTHTPTHWQSGLSDCLFVFVFFSNPSAALNRQSVEWLTLLGPASLGDSLERPAINWIFSHTKEIKTEHRGPGIDTLGQQYCGTVIQLSLLIFYTADSIDNITVYLWHDIVLLCYTLWM